MNWDEKFNSEEYQYGKLPNDFVAESVSAMTPGGRVLSVCEGEGRNGVFLAEKGFSVHGVDGSSVALGKARSLAEERGVAIELEHCDLADFDFGSEKWDAVVSIFGHLPRELRRRVNAAIVASLKPGGVLIMEGYTPRQLAFATGGPKDIELLYEPEDLREELAGLDFEIFEEREREIHEGILHRGPSAVLRIRGRK